MASAVILVETPAGAELLACQRAWAGPPGRGGAASFMVYLSIKLPNHDLRSLHAACLPSIVGGVANSEPQLLCLFLQGVRPWDGGGWAQRASVACEWSSAVLWPRRVGAKPLARCLASTSIQ